VSAVVYLVEFHEFLAVHFLCLIESDEFDIFRFQRFIGIRSLYFGEIVCSDCNESSVSCEIRMEFVL
jgi:hypothetical protein